MNNKRVNDWLLPAKKALVDTGIVKNGTISNSMRGQISSFGAAVVMGNLPAAVAFFSKKKETSTKDESSQKADAASERYKLIQAMYYCISGVKECDPGEILTFVCKNNNSELKEKFIDASIAVKLAMNFYELV